MRAHEPVEHGLCVPVLAGESLGELVDVLNQALVVDDPQRSPVKKEWHSKGLRQLSIHSMSASWTCRGEAYLKRASVLNA